VVNRKRVSICPRKRVQRYACSFHSEEEKNKKEKFKRDYPEVSSDFSLEMVDKTILMSDFGIKHK
tara:strand:+ start:618 stop:812 length:195 start_codon:yes stop_codon:yes gene_type:complete